MMRITNDSTLGAAKGDVDGGALPGHPGRQRFDFIKRYSGMIANAALARATSGVVLYAESFEDSDSAVVHLYWQCKRQRPPRTAQHFLQPGFQVKLLGRGIKLSHCNTERV